MGWASGFTFLPDGGMLINDYTGRRIIEVDAKGKVVNQWRTGSRTIASIDLVQQPAAGHLMLATFPIFLLLGLFLPGFFIARYLRHSVWWASALVISLVILFHSIFWLGVLCVPITLWTVAPILIAASAGAAFVWKKFAIPPDARPAPRWTTPERILLLACGLVGAVLLAHSAISPLMGGDVLFAGTSWRRACWPSGDSISIRRSPRRTFRTYFFVDGIPPMISFTYWWLYASVGRYLPILICLFVAAQFACTLGFTYGAASAVYSRRAGVLAAALLSACPLASGPSFWDRKRD